MELTLSVGDYVVVRKVLPVFFYMPLQLFVFKFLGFVFLFHPSCCICKSSVSYMCKLRIYSRSIEIWCLSSQRSMFTWMLFKLKGSTEMDGVRLVAVVVWLLVACH